MIYICSYVYVCVPLYTYLNMYALVCLPCNSILSSIFHLLIISFILHTLYYSCAHDNIPKMADHNILILIKKLWESREDAESSVLTRDNSRELTGTYLLVLMVMLCYNR